MPAPRGSYVAPASSPLAGQRFELHAGDAPTAPYNRFVQARAKLLGFSGYGEQRRLTRKIRQDSTYTWALAKTVNRRFDVDIEPGADYSDIRSEGKRGLAQKIGDDLSWARAEGISGMTYEQAITRYFVLAEKADWPNQSGGPYARLLELMGIREPNAPYDVGETPAP